MKSSVEHVVAVFRQRLLFLFKKHKLGQFSQQKSNQIMMG